MKNSLDQRDFFAFKNLSVHTKGDKRQSISSKVSPETTEKAKTIIRESDIHVIDEEDRVASPDAYEQITKKHITGNDQDNGDDTRV